MTDRTSREIYCAGCGHAVIARLTNGAEVYPHRRDLAALPFWRCDACRNFVGCHHKTRDRTRPLGCIPTPAIKRERQRIHAVIDPIWQRGTMTRRQVYREVAIALGIDEFHTAEIRSVEDARAAYISASALAQTPDAPVSPEPGL
jgi:hypothetical protein